MTNSADTPPPSDGHRLFPDESWANACDAIRRLYTPEELRGYRIYVFPEIVGPGFVVEEINGGRLRGPDAESRLFFVDEAPPANWGHPCRLVFITTDAGEVIDYECRFPPANVAEFRDVTAEAAALWRK
jgi:hypothetical protein